VVKYDAAAGQRELKPHRDGSVFSFNLALNPLDQYEGGACEPFAPPIPTPTPPVLYLCPNPTRTLQRSVAAALGTRAQIRMRGGSLRALYE